MNTQNPIYKLRSSSRQGLAVDMVDSGQIPRLRAWVNDKNIIGRTRKQKLSRVGFLILTSLIIGVIIWPRGAEAALLSQGPNSASATGDCVNDAGTGTVAWTSPGNAFSSNDTRTTASVDGTTTNYIKCTNFGFSIPTGATVVGIVVGVERSASATGNGGTNDAAMRIVKGGTIGATDRSTATTWQIAESYEDHGSQSDLWGETWSASDVNATNFGAAIAATKASAAGAAHTASVDHVRITVYYAQPSKLAITGYIWENDDDSSSPVDEATQQAVGSTAITGVKKGERLTLRTQIKNTGGAGSANLGLFYDKGDGVWSKVNQSSALAPAPSNCNSPYSCYSIDSLNDSGSENSIAVDQSGNPWAAYYYATGGDLRVARYVGTGGSGCTSSAWTCVTVDSTSDTGIHPSIAFDPTGNPWISYQDFDGGTVKTLRVARYVGTGGTGCASTAWTCTSVQTANNGGPYSSIAFDATGNPWVSYGEDNTSTLRVARYVGTGGTGCASTEWTCTSVHATPFSVSSTAIDFDPYGTAWVSYSISSNVQYAARYVGSGGSGCTSSAWTCEIVNSDTSGTVPSTSMAIDSEGVPWIAYYDHSSTNIKVARYVVTGGSGCTSSAWTCTTVVGSSTGGRGISIAFDPAGSAWVSYYNSVNNLNVARYVGSGGSGCTSSAWTCTAPDGGGTTGSFSSIAFDYNGIPWIAYYSAGGALNLQIAKLERSGEMLITAPFAGLSGSLNESHADMTTVPDNANRDDADCIGGGTWNNGKLFSSAEGSGVTIPNGASSAQCTEVEFTIDTSQATVGQSYRFIIASKDAFRPDKGVWRGPNSISSYPTLTIESSSTFRAAKDGQAKLTDCSGSSSWGCSTLETPDSDGQYNSIAIDPTGLARISYYNGIDLKYTQCTNTSCSSKVTTAIDTAGTDVGRYSSIGLDSSGYARISYNDTANGDLKYIQCTSADCSTLNTAIIDSSSTVVGMWTSLAVDAAGYARISYHDETNGDLKYIQCTSADCSTRKTSIIDNSVTDVGEFTSISLDAAGFAHIVYRDVTNDDLKYIQCTSADCSTRVTTIVETAGGSYSGLTLDASGFGRIVYTDSGAAVKYIQCTNASCSSRNTSSSLGSNANWTSIALDHSGYPRISYYDSSTGDLNFVQCKNILCSVSTSVSIDTTGDVGKHTATAIDRSGSALIAYYDDGLSDNLKLAKLHLPDGTLGATIQSLQNGRNARFGDARYHLDSGYSPRSSSCAATTDLKGYCGIAADDNDFDSVTMTDGRPMFTFAHKTNNPFSVPIITWIGRSNIPPNTASTAGDIVLQAYNFTSKQWVNVATNTSSSDCNTVDCSFSASIDTGSDSYYETVGTDSWLYLRVWQYENSSSETLKTDFVGVTFEQSGIKMRHGRAFFNLLEGNFDL